MEDSMNILELLLRPAFLVQDGCITQVNRDAARYLIVPGTPVADLIDAGAEEYRAFAGGRLSLTLLLGEQRIMASVIAHESGHIFILEQEAIDAHLQSMALAALKLRAPLSGMMTAADRFFPSVTDEKGRMLAAQMNRRMFQLLRIVSNMSDVERYSARYDVPTEHVDVGALFEEIFQCAAALVEKSGHILHFVPLAERVFTLADRDQLERAVYNLLSNAVKFSPPGSVIRGKLVRRDKQLLFTLEDPGCGIDTDVQSSVFSRYRRMPSLEDPSHGLGLGLLMVQLAASAHGGTVLIDRPHRVGTRVTLTLAIRQRKTTTLRTPMQLPDYAGGRSHAMIELADVLDLSLYMPEDVN